MKLKKIHAGFYTTVDGKYSVEKDGPFWYAYDSETGTSVVDSETSFRLIKESLSAKLMSKG